MDNKISSTLFERREKTIAEVINDYNDISINGMWRIHDFGYEGDKLRYLLIAYGPDYVAVELLGPEARFGRVPVEKRTHVAEIFAEQSKERNVEISISQIIV